MKPIKIAFLGSHGSGKTTAVKNTKNNLELKNKTVEVVVMGWKNFHNPLLQFFSKLYLSSDYKKNKNEERLDRFKERSWFFYIIYYIELLTRYIKVKKSKKNFVLMDRYFYEELMFMKGFKFKIFKIITPKPDFTIVLRTNSKVIKNRGHEVSEEKLINFYGRLEKLNKYFPMKFIDSSVNIKKTSKEIEDYIENDN